MKNRTWFCFALDICGLLGLAAAAIALGSALWLAGTSAEALALGVFSKALMGAVGLFLVARLCEIAHLVQSAPAAAQTDGHAAPDNVEPLPERGRLPRAA